MKIKQYEKLYKELDSVLSAQENWVSNYSNFCAVLMSEFNHHWIGFYLANNDKEELYLGPFQGPLACTRIAFGKGVCGTSFEKRKTLIVPDVHQFPGHIACSSLSNSEIVIPFSDSAGRQGVLDIDSVNFDEFNEEDQRGLERLLSLL